MQQARIDGAALPCDVAGSGDAVLLIGTGPIADSFAPWLSEPALTDRFRLITYRQRRMADNGLAPVSFARHAADAAELLGHLGVRRAHVAGHSTGAAIALQLAADHPGLVHTLVLLEPPLMSVPSAAAFLAKAGPALVAYGAGDRGGAMAAFLGMVSSLGWEGCRTQVEARIPGAVARAVADADDFFASYLPALGEWKFGSGDAAAIPQPVLSVVGTETERLFAESHDLLHRWFPQLEECAIEGAAHLLHLQRPEPVVRGVARFLARHPIGRSGRSYAEARS